MDDILSRFSINCHSSIRYAGGATVWFDPFRVAGAPCDADGIPSSPTTTMTTSPRRISAG